MIIEGVTIHGDDQKDASKPKKTKDGSGEKQKTRKSSKYPMKTADQMVEVVLAIYRTNPKGHMTRKL